jgi:hypothetical protein
LRSHPFYKGGYHPNDTDHKQYELYETVHVA